MVGLGGIGMSAVQGAAMAGARHVVAIDPVEWKREKALTFGATHTAASMEDAQALIGEITYGAMADKAILAAGLAEGDQIAPMMSLVKKAGRGVVTSVANMMADDVKLNLFEFSMMRKELVGCIFGNANPRYDIPRLLDLYMDGKLKLDEMVTTTYTLERDQPGLPGHARRQEHPRRHPLLIRGSGYPERPNFVGSGARAHLSPTEFGRFRGGYGARSGRSRVEAARRSDDMVDDQLVQAAAQAYIYGYPLVYNLGEIEKCPPARRRSGAAGPVEHVLARPGAARARRRVRPPNNDTLYLIAPLDLVGRARWCCTSPTPPTATTCSSSSTPGRTTSPTSAGAPPAPRRADYLLVPPGRPAPSPTARPWSRRRRRSP